jgi:hypothetical protein
VIRTIVARADIARRLSVREAPLRMWGEMPRPCALPRRAAAITAALVLCAAAPAAADTIAPPGNSGVDQYMEVVPSAKGPSAPGTQQRALSSTVKRKLQSHGAEGRQLAQIVKTTAPAQPATTKRSQPKRGATGPAVTHQAASRPAPVPRGASPLASVAKAIGDGSGSGGMGPVLPLLLVVSTTVLAALALWRRRSA